jgi:hypothetical protein
VLNAADIRQGICNDNILVNVNDISKFGQEVGSVMNGAGTYCHISYLGNSQYNLEYWILFAYNKWTNQRLCSIANLDHKGDLVGIQMVVNYITNEITRISYLQHGSDIELFDLHNASFDQVVLSPGADIHNSKVYVYAKQLTPVRLYSDIDDVDHYICLAADPSLQRETIRPTDQTHPCIYFEDGSHEPFPGLNGSIMCAPSHNGKGLSIMPQNVKVLDNSDSPFVFFGGRYGDPSGITRHKMWYLQGIDNFHSSGTYPRLLDSQRGDLDPYKSYDGGIEWPPRTD